jgi:hypothetical protein
VVRLELTNGDILSMDLKDRTKEKDLRDAWYAMSDMPSKKDKVLRIQSYTGNQYRLKICEIKNCTHIDKIFDHSVPELQKARVPVTKTPKRSFENSIPPVENSSTQELSDLIGEVIDAAAQVFETIPENYKRNMITFLEGLRQLHIPFDITDEHSIDVASKAMKEDDPRKLLQYIMDFAENWKKKR